MAVPEPTVEELRALSADLTRAAGRGSVHVPVPDREDVAQEALLKLVQERPKETAPPLRVRAFAALRNAQVDYLRKKTRAKEPVLLAVENMDGISCEDPEIRLAELRQVIEQLAGADALEIAEARMIGETEAEVGTRPGWTPQRAHAGRRQLNRMGSVIADELLDD